MNPQKTAMARSQPSGPIRNLFANGYIRGRTLDYGGGKGADTKWLWSEARKHGVKSGLLISHFDPYYFWDGENFIAKENAYAKTGKFDTVTCTYVLNVVSKSERNKIVDHIRSILKPSGKAYITVRADKDQIYGEPFEDGVITRKKTFQRGFTPEEILEAVPGSKLIAHTSLYVTVQIDKSSGQRDFLYEGATLTAYT